MKEITEIKKVGKGDRYKLYLDGDYAGIFEAEILARHCLKTGEKYDEDFFKQLEIENGDYACFNRGLNALEKSMKSEKMLKSYLKEKGYPSICINKAVDKLKEYGYVDDEAYAENFIATYSSSKSKRRMKYDLMSKGIKEEIIEIKLSSLDDEDERNKCLKFAEKFMKNREFDLKTKQKLYNHLLGKGYDYDAIGRVWEVLKNGRD